MKAICTILAAGVVIGSAWLVHAEMVSGIQAIVHDAIVTQDEVEGMTAPAAEVLWRQYRSQPDPFHGFHNMPSRSLQQPLDPTGRALFSLTHPVPSELGECAGCGQRRERLRKPAGVIPADVRW